MINSISPFELVNKIFLYTLINECLSIYVSLHLYINMEIICHYLPPLIKVVVVDGVAVVVEVFVVVLVGVCVEVGGRPRSTEIYKNVTI